MKVLFLPKNGGFLPKNADISKIKRALVLKGIFSETTCVCTYVPNLKFNFQDIKEIIDYCCSEKIVKEAHSFSADNKSCINFIKTLA